MTECDPGEGPLPLRALLHDEHGHGGLAQHVAAHAAQDAAQGAQAARAHDDEVAGMLVGEGHDLLAGHRLVQEVDGYLVHQAFQQAADLPAQCGIRLGEGLVVVGVQQHGQGQRTGQAVSLWEW